MMKDMRVAAKASAFPILSDETVEFTTFPAIRTVPLTLPLHVPQLHITQAANPYAATYCSAVPMKRVP